MNDDTVADVDVAGDDNNSNGDEVENIFCDICGNVIEACSCVCPYCGEREGCSCCLFDATTGGG